MSTIWGPTGHEGIYKDLRVERRGLKPKFACMAQWRGKQHWRSGFTTITQASRARVKLKTLLMDTDGILDSRRLPIQTFSKMVDALVKTNDLRKTVSKNARTRYSVLYANGTDYVLFDICFAYLAKHNRNHFGDASSVVDFVKWMRATKHSERTIEMCLRLLKVVYGIGVSRGFYKINPVLDAKKNQVLATQIRKLPQEKSNPAMRKELTTADRQKISEVVKKWRDPRAVWVGLNVWMGLRPSVFNKICFEDFDVTSGILWIRPGFHKSEKYRKASDPTPSLVPPEAFELLEGYARKIGIGFTREKGFVATSGLPILGLFLRRPLGRSTMRRTWRAVLQRAGVEYAAPYAARITMINEMVSAGINVRDIATHMGNTPETIYKCYVKASSVKDIQNMAAKLQIRRAA